MFVLKNKVFILALAVGLTGCQTVKVLDERVSARLQRSTWLKPPPVLVVRPAKAGTVKLRTGPGREHPAIRALAAGETVTPLGAVGDWRAVRIGPESGYVRSRDLRPGKEDRGLFAQP